MESLCKRSQEDAKALCRGWPQPPECSGLQDAFFVLDLAEFQPPSKLADLTIARHCDRIKRRLAGITRGRKGAV